MRTLYFASKQRSPWHLFTRVLVALLLVQPALVLAADKNDEIWYQIEIIVAKRADKISTTETFPFQPASISWHRGQTLTQFSPETSNPNELENIEFINLPADLRILNTEARMLENNADYKVLAHLSWRQILKGNKTINWIDIRGGYIWGGHQQLEGSLGFSKGRFLHVHSELHLNQFPSIQSASSQRAKQSILSAGQSLVPIVETRYSLIQRRKMRSNELHYLDHPKLVLLVKVIPYTPAEPILEVGVEVNLEAAPADEPTLIDLMAPSIVE
ncbi:MAG: hypothetical protein ACI9GE_000364 [Oceanospirillaceae bacterium]|jgi:hypothetical protein